MTDPDLQNKPRHAADSTLVIVVPHPAETPLKYILIILGIMLWIAIAVSLIGAIYAVFLGLFFFMAHIALITQLRGSAIKLGPNQLPELYHRVATLAQRVGLKETPQIYLKESGGDLNAFATKFFGTHFVVLYADLVAACGNNKEALDFIIAHELGHLHRKHLRWRWLTIPALFIPFLGSAYSRACEYTCDQYGYLVGNRPDKGLDGLYLLAAGPAQAATINRAAFGAQVGDLNSVWMRLGQWMGSHPPIVKRLRRLDPSLAPEHKDAFIPGIIAAIIAMTFAIAPIGAVGYFVKMTVERKLAHNMPHNSTEDFAEPDVMEPPEDSMSQQSFPQERPK
ncbi:MAG: M48 family metallopeptidase [Hyphomicrobium sp.]